MVRRRTPPTWEGWYVLHDFRTVDWDDWRNAPQRGQDRAIAEGEEFFESATALDNAEAGDTAFYAVVGQEVDLLIVHLRPTTAEIDRLQREFEQTAFAEFTERAESFVSVTETSGYENQAREVIEDNLEETDYGDYLRSKIKPDIPAVTHVSFYPMNRRRDIENNWYDLPFEERAEHMENRANIAREFEDRVTQMNTTSFGMDEWEFGVTLWAEELRDIKEMLYQLRFDPSSSKYAEFGPAYVGRKLKASDLPAYLEGEFIKSGDQSVSETKTPAPPTQTNQNAPNINRSQPAPESASEDQTTEEPPDINRAQKTTESVPDENTKSIESDKEDEASDPESESQLEAGQNVSYSTVEDISKRLFQLGLREGEDYEGGEFGLLFYSNADATDLVEDVKDIRTNLDTHDEHLATLVRASGGRSAVVSLWTGEEGAKTATGMLGDLSQISQRYGGVIGDGDE